MLDERVHETGANSSASTDRSSGGRPLFGLLLLVYCLFIIFLITLSPFRFQLSFSPKFVFFSNASDFILNIFLFVPLGFFWQFLGNSKGRWLAGIGWATVFGGGLSTGIEGLQLLLAGRYTSPVDVMANTAGAFAGAVLFILLQNRLKRVASHHLVLELPLMQIVYLLTPLLWLNGVAAGRDAARLWLAFFPGLAGSIVLAAVWRHRLAARGVGGGTRLALGAGCWFVVANLPAMFVAPRIVIMETMLLVGMAWVYCVAAVSPHGFDTTGNDQRFELPTLKRVAFPAVLYVVGLALWPLPFQPGPWHAALGLADLSRHPGEIQLLRLIEQVAAFTLAGYALAEARGRFGGNLVGAIVQAALFCSITALGVEVLRGIHPRQTASLLRFGFLAGAGVYGVVLYQAQLAAVRWLLDEHVATGESYEETGTYRLLA